LNKALDTQKSQSVQMSQAAVRLRELERDVEASRDVYQAFLKRSRETEEQESLNTSSARIIGEATVPQRRNFPPAMSLIAMVGFVLGGLAAAAWIVAADQLSPDSEPEPATSETKPSAPPSKPPSEPSAPPQGARASIAKPLIARLQESDVMRTLGGILASGGIPDVTRMGWPTLRAGFPMTTFLNAMREMRAPLARRSPAGATPVMGVIGTGAAKDRSIAALNIALAAARDGAKVLLIDADHVSHALSNKFSRPGKSETSLGWLNIGTRASRAIETTNGISVLPAIATSDVKSSEAVQKAVADARAAASHDLIVLDGPAMPWSPADRKLLNVAAGLVAVLPASLDINDGMETIIQALGGAERKLVGVVLNELHPATVKRQRDKQYA
jgi:Mrp family chromosome partitioning ATPase